MLNPAGGIRSGIDCEAVHPGGIDGKISDPG
jgi:hypothetical protein